MSVNYDAYAPVANNFILKYFCDGKFKDKSAKKQFADEFQHQYFRHVGVASIYLERVIRFLEPKDEATLNKIKSIANSIGLYVNLSKNSVVSYSSWFSNYSTRVKNDPTGRELAANIKNCKTEKLTLDIKCRLFGILLLNLQSDLSYSNDVFSVFFEIFNKDELNQIFYDHHFVNLFSYTIPQSVINLHVQLKTHLLIHKVSGKAPLPIHHFFDRLLENKIFTFVNEIIHCFKNDSLECLEAMFSDNIQMLLMVVSHFRKNYTIEDKIKFFNRLSDNHFEVVFANLFKIFDEEEIVNHHELFELLLTFDARIKQLQFLMENDSSLEYLKMTMIYLKYLHTSKQIENNSSSIEASESSSSSMPKDDFRNKSGTIWECIGSENVGDSQRLHFHMRKPYDIVRQRKNHRLDLNEYADLRSNYDAEALKLFPALEPTSKQIKRHYQPIFDLLGYSFHEGSNGVFITLPDNQLLMDRWKNLNLFPLYLYLPKTIELLEVDGNVTPDESIDHFSKYLGVCSKNTQFVSHHLIHLMPTILAMMQNPQEFQDSLSCARNLVNELTGRVQKVDLDTLNEKELVLFKMFKISISIFVEIYTSLPTLIDRKDYLDRLQNRSFFSEIWDERVHWRAAFHKFVDDQSLAEKVLDSKTYSAKKLVERSQFHLLLENQK